jgi:hypothetical protein
MTSIPSQFESFDSFYNIKTDTCLKYKKAEIDFVPKINQLSEDSVLYDKYAKIYVYGENFLPNGISTVQIGDQNLKVIYYNSNVISFDLSSTIYPGIYDIYVKNNVSFKAINVTGRSNGSVKTSNKLTFVVQS